MSRIIEKIQHLIALAVSEGAEPAEGRTAAYVAARLIHQRGIKLHDPSEVGSATTSRIIQARYGGRCNRCGSRYQQGDYVSWTKGHGAAHVDCVAL